MASSVARRPRGRSALRDRRRSGARAQPSDTSSVRYVGCGIESGALDSRPRLPRHRVTSLSSYAFAASGLDRVFALLFAALIAALYGASSETDVYFFALIIPLAIGIVLTEAAYTAVLPRVTVDPSENAIRRALRTSAAVGASVFLAY